MFDTLIADLLDRLDGATTPAELRDILVNALEAAGLPHIAYCHLSDFQRTGDLAALQRVMTFPGEWLEYYQARRYQAIDPVFQASHTARRPFRWQDLTTRRETFTARQRTMIAEAATVGMAHGLTVPLFGPDGEHAIVSVASPDPLEGAALTPARIAAVATAFHAVYQDLTQPPTHEAPPPPLHPREREVLLWCARGKTSWEISHILHLAERTVDHYAANAMTKLQATTRAAAVVKAVRHGMICP